MRHPRRHPEERRAAPHLEGWKQTRRLLPSFETVARKRARLPQDNVEFVSRRSSKWTDEWKII
jgi:hypothetical protein